MEFSAGRNNLITDIEGILVGNSHDHKLRSGVTALSCPPDTVASVQVLGGAPGTRETDLLDPMNSVDSIDALTLAGGSAFGLDAASGVQAALREQDRGLEIGPHRIPLVPAAIIFDLVNGGDKDWGRYPPYRELGYEAASNASVDFELGTAGAGYGALTAELKGGLGSASTDMGNGLMVGALVAVNSIGAPNIPGTRHFWAAVHEFGDEFGGLGLPSPLPETRLSVPMKFRNLNRWAANTTIGVIATNAKLTKPQAKRLAVAAHDGLARAVFPAHTPMDGDLFFGLSTGTCAAPDGPVDIAEIGAVAAMTMARAIARGVHAAEPHDGDLFPAWSQLT